MIDAFKKIFQLNGAKRLNPMYKEIDDPIYSILKKSFPNHVTVKGALIKRPKIIQKNKPTKIIEIQLMENETGLFTIIPYSYKRLQRKFQKQGLLTDEKEGN